MGRIRNACLLGCFIFGMYPVLSQSVFGTWKTIDDKTGQAKALVFIYKENGRMYGEIKQILLDGQENAYCTKCDGERKNAPIVGMHIIDGLTKTNTYTWQGDALFDPEQGKWFRCRIWLDPEQPNQLNVRGYRLFFYRTQTWKRVNEPQ